LQEDSPLNIHVLELAVRNRGCSCGGSVTGGGAHYKSVPGGWQVLRLGAVALALSKCPISLENLVYNIHRLLQERSFD
jgi:hypothetical protein